MIEIRLILLHTSFECFGAKADKLRFSSARRNILADFIARTENGRRVALGRMHNFIMFLGVGCLNAED
jgi:hypothetical protein